jgi:hypothetical protein
VWFRLVNAFLLKIRKWRIDELSCHKCIVSLLRDHNPRLTAFQLHVATTEQRRSTIHLALHYFTSSSSKRSITATIYSTCSVPTKHNRTALHCLTGPTSRNEVFSMFEWRKDEIPTGNPTMFNLVNLQHL